jgi:CRP-like cAMP-binding protein
MVGTSQAAVACRTCTLRRNPVFRGFSSRELSFVSGMKRGDIVLPAGAKLTTEQRSSIYTLYEGWAVRCRTLPNGSRQILDFVLPGDTVGLPAALLGTVDHTVYALTRTVLCELDGGRIETLFHKHAALALSLLQARLIEQRRTDARITLLGRMGATQRVGYLLLELRERLKDRNLVTGKSCPMPIRRTELADAVGLSKVHVMRALRELRTRDLLQIEARTLTIPNLRKLAHFTGYVHARGDNLCPLL